MVVNTFGATLFQPETELKELPSPESLKRKIIISTKPPKDYLESHMKQGSNLQKVKSSAEKESWRNENQADQDEVEEDDKVHLS